MSISRRTFLGRSMAATATLGPWLEIDPKTETLKNNDTADRLARGFYREPFIVPDVS